MSRVVVLYEDSRAPGSHGRDFPLHRLLLARVADLSGADLGALSRCFHAVPKKGVSNVLLALRQDYADLAPGGRVVGVVDGDRLADHVKAGPGVPLVDAALRGHGDRQRVDLGVFEHNVESVVEAIGACDPGTPREQLAAAGEKDRLSRDLVLRRAMADYRSDLRACLASRMPSFDRVAERLVDAWRAVCAGPSAT